VKVKKLLAHWAATLGLTPWIYKTFTVATIIHPRSLKNSFLYWATPDAEKLPLPNVWARLLVAGTADVARFNELGRLGFETIRDTLARNGVELDQLRDVLDFGCGCGRVLRYWRGCAARIHGTDLNDYLVEACKAAVPFASIGKNSLEPKLAYADESFDLIYALSVFTHLDVDAQMAWLREFLRTLRPGGILILTLHGDAYVSRLGEKQLGDYRGGRPVVLHEDYPGSNICMALHPPSFVFETLAQGFEIVDFVPQGAKGNPVQDLYMLRKQPESAGVTVERARGELTGRADC